MKKESFETPWYLREARQMADKIYGNQSQGTTLPKSGDLFLNFLANDPGSLIDKTTNHPIIFPKDSVDNLLRTAQEYEAKEKKAITVDLNVWQKTLDKVGFTRPVLNKLEKTADFGGSQKEKYAKQIQPAAVFGGKNIDHADIQSLDDAIAKSSIPGNKLADSIITSSVLNDPKNELGSIVIEIAKNLKNNKNEIPEGDWLKNSKAVKAIQDYAGEYLGVIALIHGVTKFPNASVFLNFMQASSLTELNYYFPSKTNTPLADSFGSITNKETKTVMNISSKGGTSGAAPSLTNLKISKKIEREPDFKEEAEFIKAVIDPSEFEGAFRLYNVLNGLGGDAKTGLDNAKGNVTNAPERFSETDIKKLNDIYANRKAKNQTPKVEKNLIVKAGFGEYLKDLETWSGTNLKNPIGYIYYYTQKIVMDAVNKHDALPQFQQCVREVLGDNFMQILTQIKGTKINVNVLYPARINGTVKLYSKSSQATFAGKIGFKITAEKGYFN
tara:strand:+ start:32 stop:1528 length:1497 start_codon:yes stop_codon:yes gene_type:complete